MLLVFAVMKNIEHEAKRGRSTMARTAGAWGAVCAATIATSSALASGESMSTETSAQPLTVSPLKLDLALAMAQPADAATAAVPGSPAPSSSSSSPSAPASPGDTHTPRGYTRAGTWWFTVGTGYANNFKSANDVNLHLAVSTFLVDDLEFAVEAAGWYFNQPGTDTGGVSGSMVFRYHFWSTPEKTWTVFADAGIGLLGAFDNVPEGGTGFNFLPRVGLGFTRALTDPVDGESVGPRFMAGVRWHHISNARIQGDSNNPSRDAIMVYAAVVFPF